ncbi:MAG: PLP-dependent aminotransferase family protein, partial [Terriglobia bacterium]
MGPFLTVQLDRRSRQSLQRQLYAALRRAILEGRLGPGARLPATRLLAEDLGISRNTVAAAFEQLWAEGYVEGRVGSGTYVASKLPEDLLAVCGRQASERVPFPKTLKPSERGRMLAAIPAALRGGHEAPRPFNPGLAALDRFPRELWARLSARLVRRAPAALLTYGDPAGYLPLRRAIAEYVRAARGVRAEADQIIVTAGSQQGLDLAARVLLDVHDTAWVEDPGYLGARGALLAAGI